jgi:predicted lipoprotein with Yx(FWY)xxD motif
MRTTATNSRRAALIAAVLVAMLVLGACGTDELERTTSSKTASRSSADDTPIAVRDSDLGEILVGRDGRTLYGFTNDVDATSTCEDACADAWPPVIVGPDWTPGPGLDSGIFATTPRSDGSLQLVAGKWPLYYYTADTAPGDLAGQGSGEVWYVVASDGTLIKDGAPDEVDDLGDIVDDDGTVDATGTAAVGERETDLGTVLVDGDDRTLYGFTEDTGGTPTCDAGCAETWWPLTVDDGELPEGLDPDVFSVVDRMDGTSQLKAGMWPLYRFSGDDEGGVANGQGTDGAWFVVGPEGVLIEDAPGS